MSSRINARVDDELAEKEEGLRRITGKSASAIIKRRTRGLLRRRQGKQPGSPQERTRASGIHRMRQGRTELGTRLQAFAPRFLELQDVIIADTGFWLALANARDRFHRAASDALDRVREPLICTWPVMSETCRLVASRLSVDAELAFMRSASAGAFQVFDLELRHFERVQVLMDKYRDLPMDLADASLVILAEELGTGRILSTDQRDFRTYRWKSRKPFRNLLAL